MSTNNDHQGTEKPQREILRYFLLGGRLTVQKALRKFGTTELRKIVSRLKRKGFDISSYWTTELSSDGRVCRIKTYYWGFNKVATSDRFKGLKNNI